MSRIKQIFACISICGMIFATGCGASTQQEFDKTTQGIQKGLSDTEITTKVDSAMMMSGKLERKDIHVSTSNNAVHLTGSVPNEQQKALAEQITKDTVGTGTKVVDELKVAASAKKS